MLVKIKKLDEDAKVPTKGTYGSSCYDIYSNQRRLFVPMDKMSVSTGLAFELIDGMGMDIRPRSGLASRGLVLLNSPATLDSDYRGELILWFINISSGNILVNKGDRVAQLKLFETIDIDFKEVKELSHTTRGTKGFGSTGE